MVVYFDRGVSMENVSNEMLIMIATNQERMWKRQSLAYSADAFEDLVRKSVMDIPEFNNGRYYSEDLKKDVFIQYKGNCVYELISDDENEIQRIKYTSEELNRDIKSNKLISKFSNVDERWAQFRVLCKNKNIGINHEYYKLFKFFYYAGLITMRS